MTHRTRQSGTGCDHHGADCLTHLVGDIGDPAHLHGIVAHLSSVRLEIVSIAPALTPHTDITTEGMT